MSGFTRLTYNGVDLSTDVMYVSLHSTLPPTDSTEVSSHGYARVSEGFEPASIVIDETHEWSADHAAAVARVFGRDTSPDAMRLDASCAEADAELAEWRALLDGAKGRRRG